MKLAITTQGADLSAPVDPRFGRARRFLVVDTETNEFQAVDNAQNLNAPQGAGIQAAMTVVELGVTAVITGNVGPKAFATLAAGDVDIYTGATGTVAEALELFKAAKLQKADGANAEAHWV